MGCTCRGVGQAGNVDFTSVSDTILPQAQAVCPALESCAVHGFLRSHLAKLTLEINFFLVSFNRTSFSALKSGCKT